MHRKVSELLQRAERLNTDLRALAPAQHLDPNHPSHYEDDLCRLWQAAACATSVAECELEVLEDELS